MNKQHIQKGHLKAHHTIGDYWLWLSAGILLVMVLAAVVAINLRTPVSANPSLIKAQSVPDAASQGIAGYILAHSDLSAQSVPDASAQGVQGYLQAHSMPSPQTVPDAAAQGVTGYLRAHAVGYLTDPEVKSVMDYLKAHGIQP